MNIYRVMTAISLSGLVFSAAADDAADKIKQTLKTRMPGAEISQVSALPYGPLYEVVANGTIFYTDGKGEIALVGNLIDIKTKTNLTEQRLDEIRIKNVDFATLPLDKAIVKIKGNGERRLAVFSDPDCPYCKRLEQELEDVTDVTIYIFLYPLTQLHPDAARKAELVWCAPNRAAAWDDLMRNGKEAADTEKCATPIKDIEALAHRMQIEGTPGLIFGDGRLFPGLLPKEKIEEFLGAPKG